VLNHGRITVWSPEAFSLIDCKVNIICDNQDRLRGDYDAVFANFHDVDWVAPDYQNLIDDSIPF